MNNLTLEQLAEIQDRVHNATPGPWGVGNGTEIALDAKQDGPGCFSYTVKLATVIEDDDRQDDVYYLNPQTQPRTVASAEDDALFIAHARQDVEDLLAEVERLRVKLDAPCGSCHPCTNYADETWRAAGRTPPHVYAWDELRAEVERLRLDAKREEQATGNLIDERDNLHALLDRFADAVAPIEVIGEHSSGNDPWLNALDMVTSAAEVDRLKAQVQLMGAYLQRESLDAIDKALTEREAGAR
jgi:hypothetical protein